MCASAWCAVLLSLAACTARPERPIAGAALVEAVALDGEHGLLLFQRSGEDADEEGAPRQFVAKQTAGGRSLWMRELAPPLTVDAHEPVRIAGGSALFLRSEAGTQSIVRVALDTGEAKGWDGTHYGPGTRVVAAVGDESQVFVVWAGPQGDLGRPAPLAVAAFDQRTGDRTWTKEAVFTADYPQWNVRLDDAWLLVGTPGGYDIELFRRRDGERGPTVVADLPEVCRAGGRWWFRRDDRLIALDLRGAEPRERAVEASFIAAEHRRQWYLGHCADHGGEVVLMVGDGVGGSGGLVAVDPETAATRWTVPLPHAAAPLARAERFGRVVVVGQADQHCAVDLHERRVLWCGEAMLRFGLADGEDTLLLADGPDDGMYMLRIGGADGEVQAAVDVHGARSFAPFGHGWQPQLREGRIWLAGAEDPATGPHDRPPHAVIDARTLRAIERPWPAKRQKPDWMVTVRDVTAETAFPRGPGPRVRPRGEAKVAADPLEHWVVGAIGVRAPEPTLKLAHERVLEAIREREGLRAGAPLHVLAWRDVTERSRGYNDAAEPVESIVRRHDVVGFTEQRLDGGETRWLLFKGSMYESGRPGRLQARYFARPPRASEVDRFLLTSLDAWGLAAADELQEARRGAINDDAWQRLTGAPRAEK